MNKRSKWKNPYIKKQILLNLNKNRINGIEAFKNLTILPKFNGMTFKIYNGKVYNNLTINESMIGHKFGEFVHTRKKFLFKKK
jgi:small subunit ribosomal protein S19